MVPAALLFQYNCMVKRLCHLSKQYETSTLCFFCVFFYISAQSSLFTFTALDYNLFDFNCSSGSQFIQTQTARFMWPTWGPPESCRPHVGPMLAPQTLLSGETTLDFTPCTILPWNHAHYLRVVVVCDCESDSNQSMCINKSHNTKWR